MEVAAANPEWAAGFEDECWWSRVASPTFSSWAEEGKPQDGVLLITNGDSPGSVRAVWVDSWHQSPQWMELSGSIDDGGVIRLEGTYPEDNRWRVIIDPTDAEQVRMAMDNVMPSYDVDYQVVEAAYKRAE
jgi:hypothetical protein